MGIDFSLFKSSGFSRYFRRLFFAHIVLSLLFQTKQGFLTEFQILSVTYVAQSAMAIVYPIPVFGLSILVSTNVVHKLDFFNTKKYKPANNQKSGRHILSPSDAVTYTPVLGTGQAS